ncbi:MAG: STAS domain-containing protein [Planctomycetota bacterium]
MANLTSIQHGDVLVVGFTESKIIDTLRIRQTGKELHESIPQAVCKKLLVNFRGVSLMSSEMLQQLINLRVSCLNQGVDLKLCELSPNLMTIFRTTTLDSNFDIHRDEEKAVASFSRK